MLQRKNIELTVVNWVLKKVSFKESCLQAALARDVTITFFRKRITGFPFKSRKL